MFQCSLLLPVPNIVVGFISSYLNSRINNTNLCTVYFAAARINKAPEATITPTSQQVNQPNDVVLDGSRKYSVHLTVKITVIHSVPVVYRYIITPVRSFVIPFPMSDFY